MHPPIGLAALLWRPLVFHADLVFPAADYSEGPVSHDEHDKGRERHENAVVHKILLLTNTNRRFDAAIGIQRTPTERAHQQERYTPAAFSRRSDGTKRTHGTRAHRLRSRAPPKSS